MENRVGVYLSPYDVATLKWFGFDFEVTKMKIRLTTDGTQPVKMNATL